MAAEELDQYIERWQLHEVVNDAVSHVLRERPADPYLVLAKRFFAAHKASTPSPHEDPILGGYSVPVLLQHIQSREGDLTQLPEGDSHAAAEACTGIIGKLNVTPRVPYRRGGGGFFQKSPTDTWYNTVRMIQKKKGGMSASSVDTGAIDRKLMERLLRIALELTTNVTQEDQLLKVIIEASRELLSADRCSLFVRQGDELVTQIKEDEIIRIPLGSGLAGHCAKTGKAINLSNAYDDPRFNRAVDDQTGYLTQSLLCAPIVCDKEVVAVAQLLNKQASNGGVTTFTDSDLDLFRTFAAFAGVAIRNAELYMEQAALSQKNQFFISVIEKLSQADMRNWGKVVEDVSDGARDVLNAERCTLFVVDKEINELRAHTDAGEIRFQAWKGVAGHVYSTGETLNITKPYADSRFNPEVDKKTGFITHSLLTMPVKHAGEVIAVVQVVNKRDKGGFTVEDEETLRYFAHFAGVTLSNSKLYDFVLESRNKAMALFERQLQVLSIPQPTQRVPAGIPDTPDHLGQAVASFAVQQSEMDTILNTRLDKHELDLVTTPAFDVFKYEKDGSDKLVGLCVHLFEELQFPRKFGLSRNHLLRFVLSVRAKYRNVPYHSFYHAFDVTQTLFTYLVHGNCQELLTEMDCFVLLVSALLHDIDHMGLNNSFHFKTETPLGILSSASGASSVLEVHHCHISLQLLENDELNVFRGISPEQHHEAFRGLISNILATDMTKHHELMDRFSAMCSQGYKKSDPEHRRLASNMLLKAADVSNITKPFEISRRWGLAVTEEFYMQGDKEKGKGHQPAPMFDRSYAQELARGQGGFIDHVGMKMFRELHQRLFTGIGWAVDELVKNREQWASILSQSQSLRKKDAPSTPSSAPLK